MAPLISKHEVTYITSHKGPSLVATFSYDGELRIKEVLRTVEPLMRGKPLYKGHYAVSLSSMSKSRAQNNFDCMVGQVSDQQPV